MADTVRPWAALLGEQRLAGAPGRPAPHRPARPAAAHLVIGSTGLVARRTTVADGCFDGGRRSLRRPRRGAARRGPGSGPRRAAGPVRAVHRGLGHRVARHGPGREPGHHARRPVFRLGPGRAGRSRTCGGCPPRGAAPPGLRPFHGTTLRFYDPALGAWRSTWIDPLNGRVRRFIGRPDGDDIILDGLDDEPAERWCFRDIAPGPAPESFRWTGEVSADGRRTWRLDEEMLIRRAAELRRPQGRLAAGRPARGSSLIGRPCPPQ